MPASRYVIRSLVAPIGAALLFACARAPQRATGQGPAAAPAPTAATTPVTRLPDASSVVAAMAPSDANPTRAAEAARRAFPAGWRFTPGAPATFAEHAMVVSVSRYASEAGVEILKAGGNAVDAAVATGFALAVTSPSNGNIGGGGFMTIRLADGRSMTLDYREVAPAAATRNMYLDENGKLTSKSTVGYLASGVPGSVAGMAEAVAKYGTMPLARVMAPAIRLAREGFVADSNFTRGGQCSRLIAQFGGKDLFCPDGNAVPLGARFRQPDLARTLQMIADGGPRAFYEGPIADSLVAEMQRGGGIITKADLRNYKPVWRTPVTGTYRGYTLISMPPASSGGTTMVETLNILENFAPLPPAGSTEYAHLVAEALRRSFTDRNEKLGDPAFVKVPMAQLTDKGYAKTLAAQVDRSQASKTPKFNPGAEPEHTTHYSVVDAMGNAVATTTTLNGGYGSGVWVRGGGFFMNNEMDDFAAAPGQPNMFGLVQGEVNAIQPGKRMLSAMSPTIVLDPQGKLLMVSGAAGGPTIITATMEVILNVIEHGMTLADAMRAPRLHHQALPDQLDYETRGLAGPVVDSLKAMGHAVGTRGGLATVNSILRVKGGWQGVAEPRSAGSAAVGY
ncbi:MAG: gamma-glutamyltransferase [Gemmatimonadota bacterium]|nr:gamma-glutamyltransferase [Gemmatimonadota bacterium]